jgi:hypothetical protein
MNAIQVAYPSYVTNTWPMADKGLKDDTIHVIVLKTIVVCSFY